MTDSVTNNYDLTLPTVGGDSGTWGTILNNAVFTPIDAILGANLAVTITSADVSLTVSQFQNAIFVLTGALTGNHFLIVPLSPNSLTVACGGKFIVVNNTTGAFTVTVVTAATASTGVVVPQGFAASLYSDGTNVWYDQNGLPGYARGSNGNPNTLLAGTAGSVNTNASLAVDYTAGQVYVCTTTGNAATATWAAVGGTTFNIPANLTLSATVSTNILTVSAFAANTGIAPTTTNPINIAFRDSTLANGGPVIVAATSSLAVSAPVGATLGATGVNKGFRYWIVVLNNGGVPVLALINCNTGTSVVALNETGLLSCTAISSGSTTAGVCYGSTTVTNRAFRILGFLTYESGLVTVGTYNNPPTEVQLFGPGVRKPGDVMQTQSNQGVISSLHITPVSAANLVKVYVSGNWISQLSINALFTVETLLKRGATTIATQSVAGRAQTGDIVNGTYAFTLVDNPQTSASTSYNITFSVSNTSAANFGPANYLLDELVG